MKHVRLKKRAMAGAIMIAGSFFPIARVSVQIDTVDGKHIELSADEIDEEMQRLLPSRRAA